MQDLIIEKDFGKMIIYEIRNGKKVKVKELNTYDYEDVIYYIEGNYDFARILCGKNIY